MATVKHFVEGKCLLTSTAHYAERNGGPATVAETCKAGEKRIPIRSSKVTRRAAAVVRWIRMSPQVGQKFEC